ncbi:MAG: hypothetical protein UU92_C0028G0005 [candidate division WWE3 bacterium GW2011_GWA1_42_12]|uniref:Uncharacterized protein n=1 Tax=Candidatus Woesebacteria bacterium GW2011_GWB1_40_12 TaxID=1618576 RepID=A0A0G0QLW3_9BACT|nr:MAG: hypothetical protein UT76_C0036G0005 [Candidatus Woesebacteria bacterium GW2011_GWB1_40_12]KKS30409.1 MAG: hypothetical protein UU92_C0028G0005 [candidate division WWE3 bacterium GW2011_GWA1_42_12]
MNTAFEVWVLKESKGIRKWARPVSLLIFLIWLVGPLPFLIFLKIAQPGFFIEDQAIRIWVAINSSVVAVSIVIFYYTTRNLYNEYVDVQIQREKEENRATHVHIRTLNTDVE